MEPRPSRFEHVVIGDQSLLIQCGDVLLARGHSIVAVVSTDDRIRGWCQTKGIPCLEGVEHLRGRNFDYLHSITNLRLLPEWLLALPRRMAINFHDGPLPRYAGLNAPVWAILNGETTHGVTWHRMEVGADTGDILAQTLFDVRPDETAFSLNARCYEAGLDAFGELVAALEAGTVQVRPQDPAARTYYGLSARPESAAVLDWMRPAQDLDRLVRALDFGPYANPVAVPKLYSMHGPLAVRTARVAPSVPGSVPGTVLTVDDNSATIACSEGALRVSGLTDLRGNAVTPADRGSAFGLSVGTVLPVPSPDLRSALDAWTATSARHETFWRRALRRQEPLDMPLARPTAEAPALEWTTIEPPSTDDPTVPFILLLARLSGKSTFSVGLVSGSGRPAPAGWEQFVAGVVPCNVEIDLTQTNGPQRQAIEDTLAALKARDGFASDLSLRTPELRGMVSPADLPIRVIHAGVASASTEGLARGATLALTVSTDAIGFWYDSRQLRQTDVATFAASLGALARHAEAAPDIPVGDLELLSPEARRQVETFATAPDNGDPSALSTHCVHQLFEAQVARTPDRAACVFRNETISYSSLNTRANQLARHLQSLGTRPGDLVGVMLDRSIEMVVALYAVHKAGAAYVPLDVSYPSDRLAHMIADSGARLVITERAHSVQTGHAIPVLLDELPGLEHLEGSNLDVPVSPRDLAYVIYTSGSTGTPKGVMIEHRNVVNFFIGMDRRLVPGPGTWLAVTSISFDISVLELFWTLARGLTVVLYADPSRQRAMSPAPRRRVDFSLFYWNVADEGDLHDANKYRLLLEGARFADTHGFTAVWNPERHFAAFGGLFPNPAVTAAAVAAITNRVAIRAGSCVVPLHSPIRIAEEWAVVDNLSNGRVGISIAAGWAPPDFAIRPEAFANAKQVMFESADIVRRLWRGDTVRFPGPSGEVEVRTLPRPIQPELPMWVTTAGNLATFEQAGRQGMHLLTHLLGQTLDDVAEKIRAYRAAYTAAGHPGRGTVTLMLHTFVGPDMQAVEAAVRGPLKAYLKSAMNLVKSAAWQFPAFKQLSEEQGKTLDEFFATISPTDLDDLLEFAFQRYFRTSGLFGTPEGCVDTVRQAVDADVDEIACLIDFGVDAEVVLQHLPYLNQLKELVGSTSPATTSSSDDDASLPALFARHQVTHFQCTPSMATMLAGDDTARPGLAALKQMMVGGEAFPPELAQRLRTMVGGRVTNMYGPTETTIWSSVADVEPQVGQHVTIGRPLPNQSLYILDARQRPLPPGVPGELVIGGAGVARGYWRREDLTAERFLPDPFSDAPGARMYRTGDLARYRDDGSLECLGRLDHQVKIRGYRVELGEIESLLRRHDLVAEAAVVLREDQPGDQRLVGYVRPARATAPSATDLKDFLRASLPEFMVPSTILVLATLPLTPNGKIDRRALPAPVEHMPVGATSAPPSGSVEVMIGDIWKRALGVGEVGTRDNFFDIGGHSLLVVQVLKELREKVDRPIQMTDLFRHTTIEALAKFLSTSDGKQDTPSRGHARAEARRAALGRRRA
jgi:natural product biosynthesis luciferase-like monooxygenase protein